MFPYISDLYSLLWENESLHTFSTFFNKNRDSLYYLVVVLKKITFKISKLQLIVDDHINKTIIDDFFSTIIEMNPVEARLIDWSSVA